jgi:hypothetical protein
MDGILLLRSYGYVMCWGREHTRERKRVPARRFAAAKASGRVFPPADGRCDLREDFQLHPYNSRITLGA